MSGWRCLLGAIVALGALPAAALAADDYPLCGGETSAANVTPKGGPALRVGVTPRVQAGQFGTPAAPAKPEDVPKTMAALARLKPPGGPLVVRLNRFFWADGET